MKIEFNLGNDETVILQPYKKEQHINYSLFELIDETNKSWVSLKLENQSLEIISISEIIIDSEELINSKLDELVHEIIEIEKSGTDNYNEGDSQELNPYDPEKIKVRTDKIPVTLIAQMIDAGDIDLNPDFQRNLVWNNFQKSRLIESILLRIPLPMFYFAEDKEGKLSVVDGLQRISTIKEFMDNKFPLRGLQYLNNSCGGRYYETKGRRQGIDSKYFRWFNLTNLSANIIDPTSPFKVKYDIFRRINTGGRPLNNQEIRNCLTGQGLREVLKIMTTLPEFKSATDNSVKSTRMDDQEIALRFLAFYQMYEIQGNIDSYNGYMDTTLDEYTESHIKSKKEDFSEQVALFSNAMRNAEYLLGRKYAFRKVLPRDLLPSAYKQLLNKALFVCLAILLAQYDHDQIRSANNEFQLTQPIAELIENDHELFYYLSYGTNGRANILYTFKVLSQLFKNNLRIA